MRRMRRRRRPLLVALAAWAALAVPPAIAAAQAQPPPAAAAPATAPISVRSSTDDKTGTNPLNLQQAVTLENDFAALPDGLFFNRSVYRYTLPMLSRRLAVSADLPLVAGNLTGRTELGFGDLRVRAGWIPWLAARWGLLAGIETSWSTATQDALGVGRPTAAPFVQIVFGPSASTIVAPYYRHRLSAGGDDDRPDVNRAEAGLYAVWRPSKTGWIAVDPRIVFDLEGDMTEGELAFEAGRLLFRNVGTYVRPAVWLGNATTKTVDWRLAVGFRIIP